jgi:hypothetical protein
LRQVLSLYRRIEEGAGSATADAMDQLGRLIDRTARTD